MPRVLPSSALFAADVLLALCLGPVLAVLPVGAASAGTVMAWGAGTTVEGFPNYGQSIVPSGLSVAAIASGYYHTVILKSDGTVAAWGENANGKTNVPAGLAGVEAVAAGGGHTVALKTDGTVVAWGYNAHGQTSIPAGLSGVTAIAAGGGHTVALKTDGTVVAWGYPYDGQTTVPASLSGVTAIAAGERHTVALKSDGTVAAWGAGGVGQSGELDLGQSIVPAGLSGVATIASGLYHTVALKSNGTVVAWGYNEFGQTAIPTGLSGVVAITAGLDHTVALKSDGTVVAWGSNNNGQRTIPTGLSGVTAIAAGAYHTVVLVAALPPSITAQPQSLVANVTANAILSVTATGTAPLSYQWRKDGVNVSGAASASLTLSNVQTNQAGNYTVVITNAYGSVTSSVAVLTIQSANTGLPQRSATITGTSLSIILRSNTITSGGIPANIYWTTYDGSTATPPLRQAIGTGLYLYSGELRPRGGGAYETDYSTVRKDDGSYLQYGSLVLNLPTTDSDANGVPDVVQVDKAVGVGVTGTTQQDFPSASSQALSGTFTRNAGTNVGTYSMVDTGTGGTAVNVSGIWEAQFFTGTLQYTRGALNSAAIAITRTNYGVAFNLTGMASFTVPSASQMNFPQFTLTNLVDGTVYTVQATTFTRSGSNYTGSFQFVDGDLRTAWADHVNWMFQIADPNDSDANGIPDLSDEVAPTITTSTTGNTLTLFWPDTVAGYRVESALGLAPTVTWDNVTGTFQTNGGFISIGLPMTGTKKFYRLTKP